jgi:hypothetical protein
MTTQITLPELATGQYNAGLILKEDGTPDYWLIGLPGELKAATWQQGMDWAKEQGGDLPNRRELNLLRANARKEFKNDMYWSNETTDYRTAFIQYFYVGSQYNLTLSAECRVRAVSRFPA